MHWIYAFVIGDYIIQNDYMAQNKKKSWKHCLLHAATFMIPFLFCDLNWFVLYLIALQHYIWDRTNIVGWILEKKGSKKFLDDFYPWSWILTDNIHHILWMAFVVYLFN